MLLFRSSPLLLFSLYKQRSTPLFNIVFDMQVKGEAIEDHINDKEATYQRSISLLYINNRGCISEAYINNISMLYISNRGCISEAYISIISVLYINNRGSISEVYFSKVSLKAFVRLESS